jgi:hypothetical protein
VIYGDAMARSMWGAHLQQRAAPPPSAPVRETYHGEQLPPTTLYGVGLTDDEGYWTATEARIAAETEADAEIARQMNP